MSDIPAPLPSHPADPAPHAGRAARIAGWIIGGLPALMIIVGGVMNASKAQFAIDGLKQMGYPEAVSVPLGVASIVCGLLYLIPQTAVFGALLLTAYMGGAVATHVRAGDALADSAPAVVFCALLWIGLLLRDRRLRELLPLRKI